MNDIVEIVKRKKIEQLILSFILLIFCIINIIININIYRGILYKNYTFINNINDLSDASKNNDKFITINLKEAKKENYSLEYKDIKANIYTLNLENINILLLIKDNTILTSKTNLEIIPNDTRIQDIKNKFKKKDYYDIVLSDVDFEFDYNMQLYKIYVLFILCALSMLSSLIHIIQIINPSKTLMYKRYMKKYNINN